MRRFVNLYLSMEPNPREHSEAGFITEAKEYLITLEGLPSVRINDVIVSSTGNRALVTGLLGDRIEALLLDRADIRVGEAYSFKDRGTTFPLGGELFGRVLNPLGDTLDGKGPLKAQQVSCRIEVVAPNMNARQDVSRRFETGVVLLDVLIPLAFGQRQLIVGPTGSGKNVFLEQVIRNQKGKKVVCIYALIGKPLSYIHDMVGRLLSEGGNAETIVITAFSEESAPLILITPSIAFSVAESFSSQGHDVLLVLDDLGTHAKYLREIALLSGRIPGRESYPGDIFYQHAHLMERAGQFNKTVGGGSITLLPVLETGIEDLTNLISTNLMAATDGHLLFQSDLHAQGFYPALAITKSVTRVGRKAQSSLGRELALKLMALLADYERQQEFSHFGTQLSQETRTTLTRGAQLRALLKQDPLQSLELSVADVLLTLLFTSLCKDTDASFVERNRDVILKTIAGHRNFEPLRLSAQRGTVSLQEFTKRVEAEVPVLLRVCRR
jgi:F-type H+/Na+-transporting ATPase subunit alpha